MTQMTVRFLSVADGAPEDAKSDQLIELSPRRGHRRPAHVLDKRSSLAINAALATGRPLLVRGELSPSAVPLLGGRPEDWLDQLKRRPLWWGH
jgi:hypothetical protein